MPFFIDKRLLGRIILAGGLVCTGLALILHCTKPGPALPQGIYQYHFIVKSKIPCLVLPFDAFGNRIDLYYCFRDGLQDTLMNMTVKSRQIKLVLYDVGFEVKDKRGRPGTHDDEFGEASDLFLSVGAGGLTRFLTADAGNGRLTLFSSVFRPVRTIRHDSIPEPVSALALDNGDFIAFCRKKGALFRVADTGVVFRQGYSFDKPYGRKVRLRPVNEESFLLLDTDNNRALLLAYHGAPIEQYATAGSAPLADPVDAVIFNRTLFILDRGNRRIVGLNRDGTLASEIRHEALGKGQCLLAKGFGLVAFTADGKALVLNEKLELAMVKDIRRSISSGVVTMGDRVVCLSAADRCFYEYSIHLQKQGETYGSMEGADSE